MGDINNPDDAKPLNADDEALADLELTEDSEAEDVGGGQEPQHTVMCATIGNCRAFDRA